MENKNRTLTIGILGVFIVIVTLLGATYAFFNYTRTGPANAVGTGIIHFTSSQSGTLHVTNVFPMSRASALATNDNTVTVAVAGDTNYPGGMEYFITAENINIRTNSGKKVPLNLVIEVDDNSNNPTNPLGTMNDSYFSQRGEGTSMYKVLADELTKDNQGLLVGYIAPFTGSSPSGVNGNIKITAFIDDDRVAISDTYDGTMSDNMGTTSSWVDGRTVLTTSEWNSLQTTPLSFQIKVEAREGIWVEDRYTKNYIKQWLFNQSGISEIRDSVTEIYFVNMTEENINTHSNLIDLKDTSKANPGVVKAWAETDPTDNTKKILYVASPGMTSFPADSDNFFSEFSSLTKVEFNNVDTSEVTNMSYMFNYCSSLTEVDLHEFGSDILNNVQGMFSYCTSLKKINMSGFNFGTSSLTTSDSPLSYRSSFEEIDLSNATAKTHSLYRSLSNCPNLKTVDMTNFYAPNVTTLKSLFDGDENLVTVKFENVRLSDNLEKMDYMFNNCSSLTSVDLSSLNTSNVDDMIETFAGCSSLTKIYVSSGWSTASVATSSGMFYNCASLVGGANTSFENSNPIDVTYAHIDGGQANPGYLTDVSQKPSS